MNTYTIAPLEFKGEVPTVVSGPVGVDTVLGSYTIHRVQEDSFYRGRGEFAAYYCFTEYHDEGFVFFGDFEGCKSAIVDHYTERLESALVKVGELPD